MADWLTVQVVAAAGEVATPPATGTPAALSLDMCVNATMAYVQRRRTDIDWAATDLEVAADMLLGAAMLANRYYQRRNSPLGTVGSPDLGLTMILRTDPDIMALLGLNRFVFAAGRAATTTVTP